jgi:DNA gyrase subunit A
MGRATQGVRLINLKGSDSIAGLAKSPKEEDEDEESAAEFIEGVDAGEGSAPDITTETETPQNDE